LNNIDIEVIKESGKRCRDQKLGIFGWTVEEWSKNSKEKWHSNKNARGFMSWDEEKIKEFRVNQRKKFCKTYEFFDPDGNKVVVDDLRLFCKKNNFSYHSMIQVGNGNQMKNNIKDGAQLDQNKLKNFWGNLGKIGMRIKYFMIRLENKSL
jgi:hypothetical protein